MIQVRYSIATGLRAVLLGRRFAEVRKRQRLDVLAAPPAGGRLANKDSIFDCKVGDDLRRCEKDLDSTCSPPPLRGGGSQIRTRYSIAKSGLVIRLRRRTESRVGDG